MQVNQVDRPRWLTDSPGAARVHGVRTSLIRSAYAMSGARGPEGLGIKGYKGFWLPGKQVNELPPVCVRWRKDALPFDCPGWDQCVPYVGIAPLPNSPTRRIRDAPETITAEDPVGGECETLFRRHHRRSALFDLWQDFLSVRGSSSSALFRNAIKCKWGSSEASKANGTRPESH